jgi:mono/diheme cytochrome c family protein
MWLKRKLLARFSFFCVLPSSLLSGGQRISQAFDPFNRDLRPVFQSSCAPCHVGGNSMGNLSLDSAATLLRGGKSGPGIVEGRSSESVLIKRLSGTDASPRMPMGKPPLATAEIAKIRSWIDGLKPGQIQSAASSGRSPITASTSSAAVSPLFAETVRPILASRCYSCHGPTLQQNGLRLDSLAAILKGSDNGKIVMPGKSDSSRLVRRLLSQERPAMPYGGHPLSPKDIAAVRKWVDARAPGPDSTEPLQTAQAPKHWSYIKPVRPAVPTVNNRSWSRNPIDNFILAKLTAEGLKPSPEAAKTVLLRRASLDLIGLPPTQAELDAFLADNSPNAYEKVVDRLFASPHYGERWARPWLDLARYADSNGYEKDNRRTAWEYRDWVIKALNQNMPFSQFTVEQIAGDMLPNPTSDQLIATGFNRNSMLNQEGGVDINEYYWYSLVDRTNTTASVWLGSTLGCAQCHNHKFDPFPQKDYYRMLAFFSNTEHQRAGAGDSWMAETELKLPNDEQAKQSATIHAKVASLQSVLDTQTPELDASQKDWEEKMRQAGSDWSALRPFDAKSKGGATLTVQPDESILASGINPQADSYTIQAKTTLKRITGVRLEVIPDPSLPHGGPGRDSEGNFFLSDFVLEAGQPVTWKSARDDESQSGYAVRDIANKKPDVLSGWAIDSSDEKTGNKRDWIRQAVFIPKEPLNIPEGGTVTLRLNHEMRHASRNVGRLRISVTSSDDPEFVVRLAAALRPTLAVPETSRTPEQQKQMAAAYRAVAPSLDAVRAQITSLNKSLDDLKIPTAMVLRERPGSQRPSAYLRERGTFTSPGELLSADVPSALNPMPGELPRNRLGLAKWLVSDDNPLTARVTVNHFWETIFGRGLVETSEDFGTQGDPPTHPELLDWLATEFMKSGWDMKHIQKLMVMSATYRQNSGVSPSLQARDPYNHLYARGPRFRVEAEMVHDLVLSESGLLSDKMYGPSSFPYQPDGVWDIPYSSDKWIESQGADRYRRSLYTFIRRSAPYPSLVTYDAPSRELCTVRRVRTNTPLQALTSLNDPLFFDAARAMAKRMSSEGGNSPTSRVQYGYRLATARIPSKTEAETILSFYEHQLASFAANPKESAKVLGLTGEETAADGTGLSEQAALTMVANVLLNLDEAVTKE